MSKLAITLKKGNIGRIQKHRATVEALGLRKIGQTVIHEDSPSVRGMIHTVDFMVDVKEVE
uniref:50S ribosomal protein L30 n=1 Tax=Ndongobacter massiliensis TaxID=1871025 RepID=UPI0009318929|nr:50S ribosomal protein L30 [Ndongobacter massiliensis]